MTAKTPTRSDHPAEKTQSGSYFVSNYPPYASWTDQGSSEFHLQLEQPAGKNVPLGIYIHIPFCRLRCKFCYFKIFTGKNAKEIQRYLDGAVHELELYAKSPIIGRRKPRFVYFGGGTPSYLSSRQLAGLADRMQDLLVWDEAEEVAFECEPGTLTEPKLRAIRNFGVTRLSLGVEHFDDEILSLNGRAHLSKEIFRAYEYARSIDFPQINIDLDCRHDGRDLGKMAILCQTCSGPAARQHHPLSDGAPPQHLHLPRDEGAGRGGRTGGRPSAIGSSTVLRSSRSSGTPLLMVTQPSRTLTEPALSTESSSGGEPI